ncbi:F0F1 ATP synthase subunit B [Bifidobacterium bombi]|uniref:ATP synthase subunit b n=1 Tax=Bifidobacterium bombi DSM 19703 TaxID=1341695 RepID=A0A080N3G1_9BIFI|nr:F0F1 ATP synthase subunit B [Bifidobacterium bombi]KFF31521.1 F0F1 ATP synthase subunit B [Bifidobacterium bombi DSM 19703]
MVTLAGGDGISLFIPKLYDIVWSLVILVVVAVFFYKYFMPKFNSIFDERAEKIEGNFSKAAKAKEEADEAKKKYEEQLNGARMDASKIRDDARSEAKQIIADAHSKADADAAQITATAQRSIASQQQQAMVKLKGDVGTLATSLAGKIIGQELKDPDMQSHMLDQMLDDMENEGKQ